MSDPSSIFTTLDAPFQNFEKGVEPIVWQSSDTIVQQKYNLKIPTLAGSSVKYSFSTKGGDISFTTEFHAAGQVRVDSVAGQRKLAELICRGLSCLLCRTRRWWWRQ
jgi:hypothetical protein